MRHTAMDVRGEEAGVELAQPIPLLRQLGPSPHPSW